MISIPPPDPDQDACIIQRKRLERQNQQAQDAIQELKKRVSESSRVVLDQILVTLDEVFKKETMLNKQTYDALHKNGTTKTPD